MGTTGRIARQERAYKASFTLALAVSMLLVAGIPLLIASALGLSLTDQATREAVNAEVLTLRNASAATARSFLTDQESLVLIITSAPRMRAPRDETRQELLATYHRIHPSFHWLGFYGPDGRLISSSNGQLDRRMPAIRAAVEAGRRGLHVTDAQPSVDDPNLPVILYSAPVRSLQGTMLGVLLVEVDLHALIQNLHQLRIRESGETYFIRDDGILITSSRFSPGAELHQRIESKGFVEAKAGHQGTSVYDDYRGTPVIGAYAPFLVSERTADPPRWIILSELDLSEAMAPVRRTEGIIAGVILILGGLTTLAVSVISRQVTTPLRSLERASAEIARGHWERRVDEDAPYEFGRLATSFNRMAAEVQTAVEKLRCSNDALQTVQERFRLVVNNSPIFLFSLDADGVFTFAEGQALSHFAGTEHSWVGRHFSDVLQEAPAFARSLDEALGGARDCDEIQQGDGVYQIWYSVFRDEDGKMQRLTGLAVDLTERKRIQQALTRTLTELKAQQEASLDGVKVMDDHYRITSYNQRFLEIWKLTEGRLAEGSQEHLIEEVANELKDPAAFLERVRHLFATPFESALEEIELKDGRVLESYTAPVVSPDGTYLGRIWRFHDLTERRALENQLRTQYSKLLELDKMKSDFVNAVSHDLRTPLTSIVGYSEFLEDGIAGPLNADQLAYVDQIQKSSSRLEGLVSDLLDFARMEAGTFTLTLEDADLVKAMGEVAESMRPQIEEAGLTLDDDLPRSAPFLRVDTARMQRVLSNLLSNAIKFTPRGGRIGLRARVDDGCFVGEVSDTGTGIAPEDLPRLFKRFSQLDAGRKHKGGTGLGLSISKSIIEAHGGSIGVESQLGLGSTFWFKLPVSPDRGVPPESPPS